jgi:hypothetical protein
MTPALAKPILAILAIVTISSVAASQGPMSAWDRLLRDNPRSIGQLSPHQREVLEVLSPAEARRWSAGSPPGQVLTLDGRTLEDWLADTKVLGSVPTIPWWSVDSGGGASTDGDFGLTGTIGQPDTSSSAGGPFVVTAGLWGGPLVNGVVLFSDGFETGTTEAWSAVFP